MRRSLRSTGIALAAASTLALLEIFRSSLTSVIEGERVTIVVWASQVIPTWITAILVSPWCAFMAARFPFRARRLTRACFAHLGGALVFVALHLALLILVHTVFGGTRPAAFWPHVLHRYVFYVAMEMSLYAAIVLVLLLLDTRREAAERAVAAARLAASLTGARLASLQAQIQPHFLFNTLNALAVLARRGDGAEVDRAIGDLGELLRASFDSSGRQEIALAEELGFLERYVSLQRIRFPDRLEVAWEIDPAARGARVPPLLVQPLLENALEHGLATTHGGHVRVSARREADRLEIEVADDGPGFGGNGGGVRAGVGLANVRERLALLYGAAGSLECGDGPGGGGRVRVRLPWRTVEVAEAG